MKALRLTIGLLCCNMLAAAALAAPAPKTTGDAGFINPYRGGQQANITFNAIVTGPDGGAKGSLIYSDPNITYSIDVQFVLVSGNAAWFAGQVTSVADTGGVGCCKVGNWIFYKVQDNGEPGIGFDKVWGEDLGTSSAAVAITKVLGMADPAGGPFLINDGNVQVH